MEELEDLTPFENFMGGIRDDATRQKYRGQIEMFLNPRYRWDLPQQKRILLPDDELAVMVNDFVESMRADPARGREQIKKYVQYVKRQIQDGQLNANTAQNRIKPIKSLLRSNDIEFSWYLIDRTFPRRTKSEDRAYTREEIQAMLNHCQNIIDIMHNRKFFQKLCLDL